MKEAHEQFGQNLSHANRTSQYTEQHQTKVLEAEKLGKAALELVTAGIHKDQRLC